jgi:hypothetical protein
VQLPDGSLEGWTVAEHAVLQRHYVAGQLILVAFA